MAGGGSGGGGGAGGAGGVGGGGGGGGHGGGSTRVGSSHAVPGAVHVGKTGKIMGHQTARLQGMEAAAIALLLLNLMNRNIQHALHSQPSGVAGAA